MSVFDTFYLLFKSNADDLKKGAKDAEKATKDLEKSIKDTGDEADKLGKSFVKAVEGATQAVAAYVSFSAIKAGILNTAQFNSTLLVQSKILDQNADDMLAYGAAVEAQGGTMEGFTGFVDSTTKSLAAQGLKIAPIAQLMVNYRRTLEGVTDHTERLRRITSSEGGLGITDPGMISLLMQTDDEYQKNIAAGKEYAKSTQASRQASRDFENQLTLTERSFQSLWSTIEEDILPVFTDFLKAAGWLADELAKSKLASDVFLGTFAALAAFLGGGAIKAFLKVGAGILGIGTAAETAATSVGVLAGAFGLLWKATKIGAVVGVAEWLPDAAEKGGEWIGRQLNKSLGRGNANGYLHPPGGSGDSVSFWMSQGYSRDQALGLAANEQRESGGDPTSRGDGGRASGLFQWHPDRVSAILRGTGIDVRSASREDQLRAAAWELQSMGLADQLKQISGSGNAASFVSKNFERPANGGNEAIIRAQMALNMASQFPLSAQGNAGNYGGNSTSFKIDEINVHTQATDANGIAGGIGDALQSEMRTTASNYDDGIER